MPLIVRVFLISFLFGDGVGVSGGLRGADEWERTDRPIVRVVFFPPAPPICGAAVADSSSSGARIFQGRRLIPPDGLADFVGETFYPPLSTRLFVPELPRGMEARLEKYRSQRGEHVNTLLNQLLTLHDATPEARTRELQTFATTQTPQLIALEAEAEVLRRALISEGGGGVVDWNAQRRWKPGRMQKSNDVVEAEAEFQVVRAAVFYADGFIAEQRGLLNELAFELRGRARKARGFPSERFESDALFFSPATTRFRLPANLSAELKEKFATFNQLKADLKRELRETVLAQEEVRASKREVAYASLAERQWPRIGQLEDLAGEIRQSLALQKTWAAPPAPPWIPAGLLEEIYSYNEDRDSYFGELRQRSNRAAETVPRTVPTRDATAKVDGTDDAVARQNLARRRAVLEFQQENLARFATLERRYRSLREALALVAEKQTDPVTGRPLDGESLLRRHSASMEEYETFGREAVIYTHYRTAMFEPGLSPAQRRLLFNYALAGLAQPLPSGDIMPPSSAKQPFPSS